MWIKGDKKMPEYGETVMFKYSKGEEIVSGVCWIDKTDSQGHHFNMVASLSTSENGNQPHFNFLDSVFVIDETKKKFFLWYDMIALDRAGLSELELVMQKENELN